ncbi:MAG: AMP-binding protein, partial [Verrucomicrobia bacterium]|nr:AMP-binding protein [Verrucomicrobiota bacterium]
MEAADVFCQRAQCDPNTFWAELASAVHWEKPFHTVCDFSRPPFARWFVGGETNLCFNALDRHLPTRGEQAAIRFLSTETGESRTLSFHQLHAEVNALAAALQSRGLRRGDRAVIYLPMIPEAAV